MTDLSLVPLDELLNAVGDRFDTMVFGGWRRTGHQHDDIKVQFQGAPLLCQGPCMDIVGEIQRAALEERESEDEEETA